MRLGSDRAEELAAKYSKSQLEQMIQNNHITSMEGIMAGLIIDRKGDNAPPTSTVLEDILGGRGAQIARAAHGGLMSIPRPGEKYNQDNFATGGIVAFDAGGEVPEEQYGSGLGDYYRQIAAQRASIPDTQAQALQAYYAGAPERAKARSKQDLNMNLIRLGANIGAQSGPFGTQNIFKGLAATAPNFAESLAGQRADEEAGIKGMADVEQRRRTEAIEGQKSAEGMYEKDQQYKAAAAKPTDFRSQVKNYVTAEKYKIANGQRKPIADELLFQEADKIIQDRITLANMIKAGAAQTGAESSEKTAETGAQSAKTRDRKERRDSYKESEEVVDKRLETNSQFRQLLRTNPKAAATMRSDMITANVEEKDAYVAAKAISSDETVPPVATKKPLSAELPKDIQKLVDKKYNTK